MVYKIVKILVIVMIFIIAVSVFGMVQGKKELDGKKMCEWELRMIRYIVLLLAVAVIIHIDSVDLVESYDLYRNTVKQLETEYEAGYISNELLKSAKKYNTRIEGLQDYNNTFLWKYIINDGVDDFEFIDIEKYISQES